MPFTSRSSLMVGAGLLAGAISGSNAYTWPDERIDYIDALVYQGQGFNGLGFGQDIRNCESRDIVEADWLRLAFHDAATHDTRTGLGGIDGSIGFETNRPENPGVSLQQSLESFIQHMTSSVSMADLIALGATMSVNACNIKSGLDTKNHSLPFRYGRIDATGPGPEGVPTPDETIGSFRDKFQYMGFNSSEMIALVACGHTLGGVHDLDFTDMISTFNMGRRPTGTSARHDFDSSSRVFDNNVAVEYVKNTTENVLVRGGNNVTKASDERIFSSDGGKMIGQLASSNEAFLDICFPLLERMMNMVPNNVKLSEPIKPILVKPDNIDISIDPVTGNITLTGQIRILSSLASNSSRVSVILKPRVGSNPYPEIVGTYLGSVAGDYPTTPTFGWWNFTSTVPASQGFSSFTIKTTDGSNTVTYDNEKKGYPVSTAFFPISSSSCMATLASTTGFIINVTAAVLDTAAFKSVQLSLPYPTHAMNGALTPIFKTSTAQMNKVSSLNGTGYSLYQAQITTTDTLGEDDSPFNTQFWTYGLAARDGAVENIELPSRSARLFHGSGCQ